MIDAINITVKVSLLCSIVFLITTLICAAVGVILEKNKIKIPHAYEIVVSAIFYVSMFFVLLLILSGVTRGIIGCMI